MTWFILFLAPIVGLLFDLGLERKPIVYILCISLLLLLPALTGYTYIIPYIYKVLGLVASGCVYYFISEQIVKMTPKVIVAIVASVVLFCILGFYSLMNSMAGYERVEKTWRVGRYKIEYITDQGFAGGPLLKYEISKYGLVPIFIKKVDGAVDNDTTNSCLVHFTYIKMDFDKCNLTLKEIK